MIFALWTLGGLLVDAYFHSTDPGLESFWTPWHALFYSGFTATAAWLGWVAVKRMGPSSGRGLDGLLRAAPVGYRLALIGVGIFAAGGVGDAIWHTIFGVETSLDALLSPTHLLLFVGLLMITSAPLRAAWSDRDHAPSFSAFLPAMLSLLITTTVVAFFFQYTWAITETWMVGNEFWPNDSYSELIAANAVLGIIVTTLISFTPLLLVAHRWRLPFGVATVVVTLISLFIAVGFDEDAVAIPAALVGGLVFDALNRVRVDWPFLAAVPPVVMWLAYLILIETQGDGVRTAPEIWGGAVVFSALAMLTVDMLIRFEPSRSVASGTPAGE